MRFNKDTLGMFLMTKSDKKCEHSGVLAEHDIDVFFFSKKPSKVAQSHLKLEYEIKTPIHLFVKNLLN